MYFPTGIPQEFKFPKDADSPQEPVVICSNRDRSLILLLTETTLHIWFCKVTLQTFDTPLDCLGLWLIYQLCSYSALRPSDSVSKVSSFHRGNGQKCQCGLEVWCHYNPCYSECFLLIFSYSVTLKNTLILYTCCRLTKDACYFLSWRFRMAPTIKNICIYAKAILGKLDTPPKVHQLQLVY